MNESYSIQVADHDLARRVATGWLALAVTSLVIGGLFVVLIVLSRTPGIQEIIPWVDFFKTALVVHVDMTVLVWFLAFAGVFWNMNSATRCGPCAWTPLLLAVLGTVIITVSPFLGAGSPLMNNYVPVLQDPIFFVGLGTFGAGFALLVVQGLLFSRPVGAAVSAEGALKFGLYTGLIASLLAVLALIWSYSSIPDSVQGERYYEMLFWGGGHVIQFTHTQLMLMAWLWLASVSGVALGISPRIVLLLFALGVAPALLTPVLYVLYSVTSSEHIVMFTWLMQYGGGLAALPLALIVLLALKSAGEAPSDVRAERWALIFSILLFGVGGIIGFMITGSNVRIPAHYHGSIVGVTLAFMGITYHILPRLGFRKPSGKWVDWQPVIYGGGQLVWVLAMAYTGGHGVARKTAGTAQGLKSTAEHIAMGIMGLGGVVAIVGGLIFLVVVLKTLKAGRQGG
jgi:heme/copper-type cytochrome/quinol oxidase subunit 1